jgi:hypothetical protein
MNPIQLLQSMVKADRLQQASSISIKPGQLIHGRVEKIFPNNTALVQLGSMKMHAHIEAPLELAERYLFEVQPGKNGELLLKVLENKISGHQLGQAGNLLTQFQLPDTKVNLQLLQYLLSKDLPISKDHINKSALWLKEVNDTPKGLSAIEMMMKKDLPFTKEAFKSLVAFQSHTTISSQIEQVSQVLESPKFQQSEAVQQLRSHLAKLQGGLLPEQGLKVVNEIADLWLSPTSTKRTQNAAFRLLQTFELLPKMITQDQALISLLKNIEIGTLNKLDERSLGVIKNELLQTASTTLLSKIPVLVNELYHHLLDQPLDEDLPVIKHLVERVLSPSVQLENGPEVKQLFKQVMQSLGLEYEKDLGAWAKSGQETMDKLESLKPLLLKVMSELGTNGREFEPLLNRITGLQLLAQESNGPLQQLYMQLPISFGDKRSDVTLQWSGRKKKNGQIDPSFCRILFYLDLQNIEQTVIDMQVQNRVINITVINDTAGLESIISNSQLQLKDELVNLEYMLSSIKVIPSIINKEGTNHKSVKTVLSQDAYQGVDIKI